MPRIVETTVYELNELSGTARERARAWYREGCLDWDWHECIYEDFDTVCGLLGVTLRTSHVPLMGGGTRETPRVFFRGFHHQGDGASFEGDLPPMRPGRGSAAIRAHAPRDAELHAIADALADVQRPNFYQLGADIRQSGHYCHEYTMAIEVERDSPAWQDMTDGAGEAVIEALRDLARWLYRQLEREYRYLTSDEAVDENIEANGFTFTAEGCRFG